MSELLSVGVLLVGKTALATMASRAVYKWASWPVVPKWLAGYVAGAMLVAVLWALSGVR